MPRHRRVPIGACRGIGACPSAHAEASARAHRWMPRHRRLPIGACRGIGACRSVHAEASARVDRCMPRHRRVPIGACRSRRRGIGACRSIEASAHRRMPRHRRMPIGACRGIAASAHAGLSAWLAPVVPSTRSTVRDFRCLPARAQTFFFRPPCRVRVRRLAPPARPPTPARPHAVGKRGREHAHAVLAGAAGAPVKQKESSGDILVMITIIL